VIGPGKYDDACTIVREMTGADCVLVAVIGGSRGHGFSVQTTELSPGMIADLLENIARQLREDL